MSPIFIEEIGEVYKRNDRRDLENWPKISREKRRSVLLIICPSQSESLKIRVSCRDSGRFPIPATFCSHLSLFSSFLKIHPMKSTEFCVSFARKLSKTNNTKAKAWSTTGEELFENCLPELQIHAKIDRAIENDSPERIVEGNYSFDCLNFIA